jgi:hypothetical protein|nr:MAG TPA: hyaluronidase [Caudoviricetes sp.]
MIKEVEAIFCVRNDTAENFESNNTILDNCEIGYDTTNKVLKIGDGQTPWNDLDEYVPNKIKNKWQVLNPGITVLPYGTYLIKVDLADGSAKVGAYGTTITDLISMDVNSVNEYILRGYDEPSGPLHVYIANGVESTKWHKTARIKIVSYNSSGFKVDLYISEKGAYALDSSSIVGSQFYPTQLASSVETVEYKISYKRLM